MMNPDVPLEDPPDDDFSGPSESPRRSRVGASLAVTTALAGAGNLFRGSVAKKKENDDSPPEELPEPPQDAIELPERQSTQDWMGPPEPTQAEKDPLSQENLLDNWTGSSQDVSTYGMDGKQPDQLSGGNSWDNVAGPSDGQGASTSAGTDGTQPNDLFEQTLAEQANQFPGGNLWDSMMHPSDPQGASTFGLEDAVQIGESVAVRSKRSTLRTLVRESDDTQSNQNPFLGREMGIDEVWTEEDELR